MKITLMTLAFLFLSSCKSVRNEKYDFDLVDVSIYDGWRNFYCLKVDSKGKTYIFNNRFREGEKYFKVAIGQDELDSISFKVKGILNAKLDTLYEENCQDCGAINLIIKNRNGEFKIHIQGIDEQREEIRNVLKFVDYLYVIIEKPKSLIDSVIIFESQTKMFFPPPPPPLDSPRLFIPPDSVDMI